MTRSSNMRLFVHSSFAVLLALPCLTSATWWLPQAPAPTPPAPTPTSSKGCLVCSPAQTTHKPVTFIWRLASGMGKDCTGTYQRDRCKLLSGNPWQNWSSGSSVSFNDGGKACSVSSPSTGQYSMSAPTSKSLTVTFKNNWGSPICSFNYATACDAELHLGDQIGWLQLYKVIMDDGLSMTMGDTCPSTSTSAGTATTVDECEVCSTNNCKDKPSYFTWQLVKGTGTDCSATDQQKACKVISGDCKGAYQTGTVISFATSSSCSDKLSYTNPSTDLFSMKAPGKDIFIKFSDKYGKTICTAQYDADCDNPVTLGDQIGWLKLYSVTTFKGVTKTFGKDCAPQGGSDPWIVGLRGQRFFFDGKVDQWFNAITDKSTGFSLHMHMSSVQGSSPGTGKEMSGTFVDGVGLRVKGSDGVQHTISVVVKDSMDFDPQCPPARQATGPCIANGALEIKIDNAEITAPGFATIGTWDSGLWFTAFNSPFNCKAIPDAHFHWDEQVSHMMKGQHTEQQQHPQVAAGIMGPASHASAAGGPGVTRLRQGNRRALLTMNPLEAILSKKVFGEDDCMAWVQDRLDQDDIYDQAGALSTVLIGTTQGVIRLEYHLNLDDKSWFKHNRFDFFLNGFTDFSAVDLTGVIGETALAKKDRYGKTEMSDRNVILTNPDDQYMAHGPFN